MMKIFYLILLIFTLSASNAWAALAVANSEICTGDNVNSCTTSSVTTTSGSLFVCDVALHGLFTSVTDSKSNTYASAVAEINHNSEATFGHMQQRYVENGTGGASHSFTLTMSIPGWPTLACKEITGAAISGALDQTATYVGTSDNTSHSTASTSNTSQANEIITGAGSDIFLTNFTLTAPSFTQNENQSSLGVVSGIVTGHRIVSATGTFAFTFDTSETVPGYGYIATYKASMAAVTLPPRRAIVFPE